MDGKATVHRSRTSREERRILVRDASEERRHGWIIAADRDTSFAISRNANVDESKNTKENGGGPQEYSNFNKLKYSFGFFLPDGYCNP